MPRLAVVGGLVVTPQAIIENGTILCEDGLITYIGPRIDPPPNSEIINADGNSIMPGFIDTHFHGSSGYDVMADGVDGINRISEILLKYGVTGFLVTTVAAKHDAILRCIENTVAAELANKKNPNASEILGIHLEGPYINTKIKGAQPEWGIRDPDLDECNELLEAANGRVKIMTMAPELPNGMEMIRFLKSKHVAVSLGHSICDYDTALAAIDAGASRATHLFNAMSGVHHRNPGLASAALNEPGLCAELICDGVHLHPQTVNLAWKAKGRDGLALITDAAAAQGMPDGQYTLGDFKIIVRGSLCTLSDGTTIAGSVLTMNNAAKNAIAFTGMSLIDVAHMSSYLPAKACGVENKKGSLEIGKDADMVILSPDFAVTHTIRSGIPVYKVIR